MSCNVYITGQGIVSSMGIGVSETLQQFKYGQSGIAKLNRIDSIYKGHFPAAEVKFSDDELRSKLGVSQKNGRYSRTSLLGMLAAQEAIRSSGIENIQEKSTALISANSVGGMDRSELFFDGFLKNNFSGKISAMATHDCGDSTEKIADFIGIKDFITTISTACSSSANAILLGARLIRNGIVDRALVGGVDALTKFTLNGFNTLLIYDQKECRPFDDSRNGLNLGEGAGYLVLESEKSMMESKKKPFSILSGYANTNDAYHQTASSPDGHGAYLAMEKAIQSAGLNTNEIDYINVHGTGTQNNDLSESIAIQRIFGNQVPMFSSTKSFTGHTLGAAGGIEAVFCLMAIENQMVFPNLRFENAIKETGLKPVTKLAGSYPIRNVLSNSFGFGGNNTSLIFSKV